LFLALYSLVVSFDSVVVYVCVERTCAGRIVTVETLAVPLVKDRLQLTVTRWSESVNVDSSYAFVLRVFTDREASTRVYGSDNFVVGTCNRKTYAAPLIHSFIHSFIHSDTRYIYSASSSPLLFRGAFDYASEGLAQGPYVAARVRFEPATLRMQGAHSLGGREKILRTKVYQ